MKINFIAIVAFLVNAILVLFEGIIAMHEGYMSHTQMGEKSLPWLNHGGSWADLIIISIVIAMIIPYRLRWKRRDIILCGILSAIITIACHVWWAISMPISSHIINISGQWFSKLTIGGYYHLVYMWIVLAIIILYYFATPSAPKKAVSIWLGIYVVPAIIQPSYYIYEITGVDNLLTWPTAVIVWILIILVGVIKRQQNHNHSI